MHTSILVSNIQRFSLHDGPGIRTTCFLKGCSLRCPWCSNPENISFSVQKYVKNGINGQYGLYWSPSDLCAELKKDRAFFGIYNAGNEESANIDLNSLPGGVTFSGGECLLQIQSLIPVLECLKKDQIHIAIETSLFAPQQMVEIAINYVDLFYIDIKQLDSEKCKNILHGNLDTFLSNLNMVAYSGKPIVFRIPVIGGYTDSKENQRKVIELICSYMQVKECCLLKIELLKEHDLGLSKYDSLGIERPKYIGVSDALMEEYLYELQIKTNNKIPIELCRI